MNTTKNMKDLSKKIKPLSDRIVVKEADETSEKKTSFGLIIPAGSDADKAGKRGEVVAVGPGRVEDGKLIKMSVKIGDKVIFQWGDKVKVGDDEYFIVRESEVLAIVNVNSK